MHIQVAAVNVTTIMTVLISWHVFDSNASIHVLAFVALTLFAMLKIMCQPARAQLVTPVIHSSNARRHPRHVSLKAILQMVRNEINDITSKLFQY